MTAYRKAVGAVRSLGLESTAHRLAGALHQVATNRPVFHLTFDDGPHPEITPRVLDVLDEHDAKATFFVLTERAQRHPDLLHETMRRGHLIALHTRTHPRLTDVPSSRLRDEICVARDDLEAVAGAPIEWFRPPYGAQNLRSLYFVRKCALKTVLWSVDSRDWKGLGPEKPLERSLKGLVPGGIILLHDVPVGADEDEDEASGYVAKDVLTRLLLEELAGRNLEAVSLDELLSSGTALKKAKLG